MTAFLLPVWWRSAAYNACPDQQQLWLEFAMNGIPAGAVQLGKGISGLERIASSTTLPVIVDGENGGGVTTGSLSQLQAPGGGRNHGNLVEDTLPVPVAVDYFMDMAVGMDRELWAR